MDWKDEVATTLREWRDY